jgi:hypothetical protein
MNAPLPRPHELIGRGRIATIPTYRKLISE